MSVVSYMSTRWQHLCLVPLGYIRTRCLETEMNKIKKGKTSGHIYYFITNKLWLIDNEWRVNKVDIYLLFFFFYSTEKLNEGMKGEH